jgi:hypothetical protein
VIRNPEAYAKAQEKRERIQRDKDQRAAELILNYVRKKGRAIYTEMPRQNLLDEMIVDIYGERDARLLPALERGIEHAKEYCGLNETHYTKDGAEYCALYIL